MTSDSTLLGSDILHAPVGVTDDTARLATRAVHRLARSAGEARLVLEALGLHTQGNI